MSSPVSALRTIAATLALSAMLLRALLPNGWMPNISGIPGAPLVICSVDGAHHVVDRQVPTNKSQDDHGFACPFASAAHFAPPQLVGLLAPPTFVGWSALQDARLPFEIPSHWSEHSPRGPPTSV